MFYVYSAMINVLVRLNLFVDFDTGTYNDNK